MKKFLAILLVLASVLGLCACGSKDDGGKKSADGKITFSIGIPTSAKIMDLNNNDLTNWVEEQCNCEIKFVEYAGGTDVATQISTTVAARQELPDILFGIPLTDDAIATYGRDGYFVDLTPYYEDREGASKTFWTRIEENLTAEEQETVIRKITDADSGKIYTVPTIETSMIDKRYYQPWINQTWLDKLGMDMPNSPETLYDFLVAVKNNDVNGNGDTTDEIPLYGAENIAMSGQVVKWLINMFTYYNPGYKWQPDENGQLVMTQITDGYREGLKFAHKLYEEGLLSNMIYTTGKNEMKGITTPNSGIAMCGIFCAHLTSHTTMGNEVMYEYAPMPLWGCAVEADTSVAKKVFISTDCAYPDEAFDLLMTLFSWDGSMRIRYGAYGPNWTDADEGSKSDMGLDAEYKLISDPFTQQSTANWGVIAGCFNHYAEGETAQMAENLDEWTKKKSQMHAESYRLFEEAQANNPENLAPLIVNTTEENEAIEMVRTNINALISKAEADFVTGIDPNRDINSDASWQAYLNEINEMGYDEYQKTVQAAYDRQ